MERKMREGRKQEREEAYLYLLVPLVYLYTCILVPLRHSTEFTRLKYTPLLCSPANCLRRLPAAKVVYTSDQADQSLLFVG